MAKEQTIVTCSFHDEHGGKWSHTTMAHTTHEAVRNSWKWFNGDFWQGPRPTRESMFTLVTPAFGTFRVRVSQALPAAPEDNAGSDQASLFPAHSEPFDPR